MHFTLYLNNWSAVKQIAFNLQHCHAHTVSAPTYLLIQGAMCHSPNSATLGGNYWKIQLHLFTSDSDWLIFNWVRTFNFLILLTDGSGSVELFWECTNSINISLFVYKLYTLSLFHSIRQFVLALDLFLNNWNILQNKLTLQMLLHYCNKCHGWWSCGQIIIIFCRSWPFKVMLSHVATDLLSRILYVFINS